MIQVYYNEGKAYIEAKKFYEELGLCKTHFSRWFNRVKKIGVNEEDYLLRFRDYLSLDFAICLATCTGTKGSFILRKNLERIKKGT